MSASPNDRSIDSLHACEAALRQAQLALQLGLAGHEVGPSGVLFLRQLDEIERRLPLAGFQQPLDLVDLGGYVAAAEFDLLTRAARTQSI